MNNFKLMNQIKNDIIQLSTQKDSDNRGLSDRMLFYLNSYVASKKLVSKSISDMLLNAADEAVIEYNSYKTHEPFSILFFELYYSILKKVSRSKLLYTKCNYYFIDNFSISDNSREFIKLYHSFGIYWGQKIKIPKHISKKCAEFDKGGTQFIKMMNSLNIDIINNNTEAISWTHNHYLYFATLFTNKPIPREIDINKNIYIKYLRTTADYAMKDTEDNYDYIGECVEQILFLNKKIHTKYIKYLLNFTTYKSHHSLVTASIVPFSLYLKYNS